MATHTREKFATQVDMEILNTVRNLAQNEGRQIQSLVEEALSDLIEKRRLNQPRSRVMNIYQTSHKNFATLYKKLAE
ncbi:hypothetical protein ZMO1_ZMOp39x020 (plasmid) [Zymomonas mobilis subsp. mobilis ZM4 = ATCC 31821]|uniref:hypothetical protein n=1 Tax=Zymomonas mobilis TaxID=542 RepID=UPI000780D0FB|nr:hypothetical protein [Zymomonas mobilis]AVZ26924.1 hypothetical protein ZMO2_ZMOp39x020 [Zymomonas mobilis subsp. mobilis]AVZ28763.1 hypothetical protein ZMO3_ZMOp39x020 [Zymomonas mobilis subsp. mobilis]AVZ43256.1 hypothetical protein ZMO1_ZMOp39x020 [Zymomonas mobilis subsp. mobilis ZM4 = ATCC 31821]UBQ08668.1 hypothetical protein LB319_09135 [Zymomonas mobilis]